MKTRAAVFPTLILLAALGLAACVAVPQAAAPTTVPPAPAPTAEAPAAALHPPIAEVCNGMAQAMMQAVTVEVTQSDAPVPITDPVSQASGTVCRAQATGTGEQFSSPDAPIKALTAVLTAGGWQEDIRLQAGGPTGAGTGFRSRDLVCLAVAGWTPDPSANCPNDQPISACKVTPAQQRYTMTLDCAQAAGSPGAALPNPASQNCVALGGRLEIEARGDGGQFGVCYFEDNRQCEEWALMRGQCPAGGVKVTGYVTPAARYCAISGGAYAITGKSGGDDEQGICTLPGGAQCDAWGYYNGACDASTAAPAATVAATEVITYTPGLPAGKPREGNCWTSSLAVWRADAWRCMIGNEIYDPCFSEGEGVICDARPMSSDAGFALKLTEPLPTAEAPQDTAAHAWLVELADGTVCEFATGATGGVNGERFNYLCPSPDPSQYVVILGELQPGAVWMAQRAVVAGGPPEPTVLESALTPVRTVWR